MHLNLSIVLLTLGLGRSGETRENTFLASITSRHRRTLTCPIPDSVISKQWYLKKLNVLPAWSEDYTGTGIVVGVVDVGINRRSDLAIRDDLAYKPWQQQFYRARFISVYIVYRARHGTEVAGVIAARTCRGPIGIAFNAQVADLRALSADSTTNVQMSALNHRLDGIHIYSSSFTNFHSGFTIHPLSPSTRNYLKYGTEHGRVGNGAIYVWSTGNSGGNRVDRDSCAYDGYLNNPYVIPVGGVSHDFQPITKGEECSAILVSAFTTDFDREPGKFGIFTLDGQSEFTNTFGQNSAAVPMVSAAIALTLQANMSLTYRDVMHILVNTARSKTVFSSSVYQKYFKTNAAGFSVSSRFGFGVIDVKSMIDTSRTWNKVPALQTSLIFQAGGEPLTYREKTFRLLYASNKITYLEHVELSVNYNAILGGQIRWHLKSPKGMISEVLPGRYLDIHRQINVTVISVQFWGEDPRGEWTLMADISDDKHNGYLLSWSLTLYGYTKDSSHFSQSISHGYYPYQSFPFNGVHFQPGFGTFGK